MRPSFTVPLLFSLLILFKHVQGIRLEKGSNYKSLERHKSIHVEEITLSKRNNVNGVEEEAVVYRDGQSSAGNNRKLVSVAPSTTTTTTSKNEKNGTNKADPISNGENGRTVNSLSTSEEHPDGQFEHYPDVVDLAEMDYSPARRKTPIHN